MPWSQVSLIKPLALVGYGRHGRVKVRNWVVRNVWRLKALRLLAIQTLKKAVYQTSLAFISDVLRLSP